MKITKTHWILIGIFLWGIPTAVFGAAFLAVIKPGHFPESQPFDNVVFVKMLIILAPIFIIIGLLYGVLMSKLGQKKESLNERL